MARHDRTCRCLSCLSDRGRTGLTPIQDEVRKAWAAELERKTIQTPIRYQDLHEQLSPNDFPETLQHNFAPMPQLAPGSIRGLAALVPDVENVESVTHLEAEQRCIVRYDNGTTRSVAYAENMGSPRQLPPMRVLTPNATPRQPVEAPPAPPPPLPRGNFRRIRLE